MASAQPNVDSYDPVILDGQTFTIVGSNFGTKSNPAPVLWDNFDAGVLGQRINRDSSTWHYGGTNSPEDQVRWDNRNLRNGRGLNAGVKIGNLREIIYLQDLNIRPNEKAFFSFWWASDFDPTLADHYKVWRICDGPIDVDTYPDITTTWTTGEMKLSCRNGGSAVIWQETGCSETQRISGLPVPGPGYQWQNVQVQLQVNSRGVCNGVLKVYMDGVEQFSWDFVQWMSDETDDSLDMFWLGNYVKDGAAEWVHSWFDDVYVDKSWARVEIGDDLVYANCSQREMQIPTSWSSGQITCNANRGSFPPGQRLFLFVVDANGVPSAGVPLEFATSGDDATAPVIFVGQSQLLGTIYGDLPGDFVDGRWRVVGRGPGEPMPPHYLQLAGTASDDVGIARVTWSNSLGGSGNAAGSVNWSIEGIELKPGVNVITITCYDLSGNATSTSLTIDGDHPAATGIPIGSP
ncbi:MAG: hypothetical protein R6X25_06365 [Candidatus Krumholzibacteriia bacterium]